LDFLLSIDPRSAPWFWGEINAWPLDYSPGVEPGHLVAEVAFGFVGIVVSSVVFPFPLLHLLLGINPWSTWSLWSQICETIRLQVSHCHYIR